MIDVQWAFISIVMSSFAHFILRIVLGKELGPEGLGVYTLAFTIYLFGMQFSAFGIGVALTKYVAQFLDNRAVIKNYVSSGMTSSIITGTIMGFVLFILAPYIAISFFKIPELEPLIRLTAFSFPFIAIQKAVLGTLNGYRRMNHYALLNIAQNVSVISVSIALVLLFGLGVYGAVIGLVGSTIIISILSPLLIKDSIGLDISLWHIPALRETTTFGFYIVLSNSISFINTQVGSILIGHYLDAVQVGLYAVAVLLSQILTLIPNAVQLVTAPATARLYGKGDIAGIRHLVFSTLKKSLVASVGIAVFLALFGPFIIGFLFTKDFDASYVPLIILLLGYTIGASFGAVGATLTNIGKVHIIFRISGMCCLLNILLTVLLVPNFGINGAAAAQAATVLANFTITLWLINDYLKSEER